MNVSHPIFGSNWNNGAKCRSRYSKWNNAALNLNSNNSSRLVSGSRDTRSRNSTAGYSSLSDIFWQNTQRRQEGVSKATERPLLYKLMKRHGNIFQQIVNIDNIYIAYNKAKKGKAWQNTIKRVEKNLDNNLLALQKSLINKTFTTSEYRLKRICEPKERDIYILPFYPDRIVQHAVMNVVEPIWDNLFIHDSYACRTGKGQHKGSTKCMQYVRSSDYVLKCDISKFYPSIDKVTMRSIIRQKIKCPDTLWLLDNIINSTEGNKNVPIGNYTSQWLGNLYLNELDRFVKHTLKCKKYIRYCDDFCLFSNSKQELHDWKTEMEQFLNVELKLSFSKASIFPISQGVDYLGYRHFKNKILLRKSTAKRVKRRVSKLIRMINSGRISVDHAYGSIQSTKGWLKWANTYNLKIALQLEQIEQEIKMKGFPKHINSKQDVMNCLKEWPDRARASIQQMIDNRHSWLIDHKMTDTETGIEDSTHKINEVTDEAGNITERYQMVWQEDPNTKLFRLGFSVSEAQNLI